MWEIKFFKPWARVGAALEFMRKSKLKKKILIEEKTQIIEYDGF